LWVAIPRSHASHCPGDSPANRSKPRWASSSDCGTTSEGSTRAARPRYRWQRATVAT
jgi:hypothetical protein